jgi:hypothetical protein
MKRYIIIISIAWILIIFSLNAHADEILYTLEGTLATDPNPLGLGDVYGWNNQPFIIKIKIDDTKLPFRVIAYNGDLPYNPVIFESAKQASDYYADIVELKVGIQDLSSFLGQTTVSMAHFIRPDEEDHLQFTVNGPSSDPDNPNIVSWFFRSRIKYDLETVGKLEIFPVPIPANVSNDSAHLIDLWVQRGDPNVPTTIQPMYLLRKVEGDENGINSMSLTVTVTEDKPEADNDDEWYSCFINAIISK